jgi:hypothetical protein
MWPARKSDAAGYEDPTPARDHFALSHTNSIDIDYGYDAEGRPLSTGLRVRPIDTALPDAIREGRLESVGRVARVVHNRRPGRPTVVWVNFALRENPDLVERLRFEDRQLLVIGSPSGM